ncbi:MAG: nucleotidyltransferase [Polyangiaceae bacterium]|nr:nucleotidyltransferase [Polyangiaceae bacterium]
MTVALSRALLAAVAALDAANLRYAVVGGLAVGAWGVSRSTRDADLYAELPADRRPQLQRDLRAAGFEVPAMNEELQAFGVFRSRSADGIFVDIFDAVGPLGEQLLSHRRQIEVFGQRLWVTAPEELFLLKAFSDRARDFEDLVALASAPRLQLDLDYIQHWAERLDRSIGSEEVTGRVKQALAKAHRRQG